MVDFAISTLQFYINNNNIKFVDFFSYICPKLTF